MAARRLVTPDQPAVVRGVLTVYEFLSSLQFAVVLISSLAIVLGVGTFVESAYGTEAVKFGVWDTWWFTLLNALLAVSIFCAAAIRYPWKRHQTGFVITHIGLLVLLAGCLLSQRGGIDAPQRIEAVRGRRHADGNARREPHLEEPQGGAVDARHVVDPRGGADGNRRQRGGQGGRGRRVGHARHPKDRGESRDRYVENRSQPSWAV
jgi:hypothetical protein